MSEHVKILMYKDGPRTDRVKGLPSAIKMNMVFYRQVSRLYLKIFLLSKKILINPVIANDDKVVRFIWKTINDDYYLNTWCFSQFILIFYY